MKRLFFLTISLATVIAFSATVIFAQSRPAGRATFLCDRSGGQPTTVIDITLDEQRAGVDFLHWSRAFPSKPVKAGQLCSTVSRKLQRQSNTGQIRIGTGIVEGGRTVVCFLPPNNRSCTPNSEKLFTLERNEKLSDIRDRLFDDGLRSRFGESDGQFYGPVRISIFL